MNIDKSNYESWFLDYFEGTLSTIKVAELFLFLHQHPEFQAEFDAFKPLHLSAPEHTVFDAKEALKRDVLSKHNIDYYLVRELENDLTLKERNQLNDFIKRNPELEKTRELFRKTKLPVAIGSFPDKKSLKKKIIVPLYNQFNFWAAAAAIIIMVLGIIYITKPGAENRTAEKNITKEDTVKINLPQKFADKDNNKNKVLDVNVASDKKSVDKNVIPVEPAEKIINHPLNQNYAQSSPSQKNRSVRRSGIRLPKLNEDATEETREDLAMVECKAYHLTSSGVIEAIPEKRNVESATALVAPPIIHRNTFDDRVNELKTATVDKVNSIAGEEILYSQVQNGSQTADRLPLKSRMIKLFAWSLNKISGERVKMRTDFDFSGNLSAYEISAGKLKVEREF